MPPRIPPKDNVKGAVTALRRANEYYRHHSWPAPHFETTHCLQVSDARNLSWIADNSVHLIVTSPPYFDLKVYNHRDGQLGDIHDYDRFLDELDKTWKQCAAKLVPGGRICCVVGDVCLPRKKAKRHYVLPLHSDIQVRARSIGLDCLTPIFWSKIANANLEAEGNGAGFLGKPYQPGAIIKNDTEFILFLRKPGGYRSPTPMQRALSMLNEAEMKAWLVSSWTDIKGASTRKGHPAPYPPLLAERLIKLFSYAGDTVLDPFVGSGSTSIGAITSGRNSIGSDIDPHYIAIAETAINKAAKEAREKGLTSPNVSVCHTHTRNTNHS